MSFNNFYPNSTEAAFRYLLKTFLHGTSALVWFVGDALYKLSH